MREKRLSTIIVALCLVLLLPNAAMADNCGGLDDCYGTILAAILAILGIALFIALWPLLPAILTALGEILTAVGIIEFGTGRSVFTGEPLALWERILGIVPGGKILKEVDKAYDIAKAGGKYSGALKEYIKRPTKDIQNAVRSYERQVEVHRQKLANPANYVPNWHTLRTEHQQNLLRHWQQDLERNAAHANIMRGILKERGIH